MSAYVALLRVERSLTSFEDVEGLG